jgi:aminoglycoside phosphotransferase (APT) family kinase protein
VSTWHRQWGRVSTRNLPTLERLVAGLNDVLPEESGHAIVHGDYRLDNVIFDIERPSRVAAIIDWEMSTLGDPLADLGLLLVYWDPVTAPVLGVRHAPTANVGFPSAAQIIERYADLTQKPLTDLSFYRALGYFKLAVIAEGIHQRFLRGDTVGDGFGTVGGAVEALVSSGLEVLS